MREKIY